MKYALIRFLPDVPAGGVLAGIDWANADHVACVVDMAGRILDRFSAVHDKAGIEDLIARLRGPGSARSRSSGGRCPGRGAAGGGPDGGGDHVQAGQEPAVAVRVGRGQGRPVRFVRAGRHAAYRPGAAAAADPDTPATLALRAAVRARKDLVGHRVAACNQLRAQLAVAFPAAVGLFCELDSPISLAFLAASAARTPRPARSARARRVAEDHPGAGPPGGVTGEEGAAHAAVTAALTATVTALAAHIKALETTIGAQLAAHPDGHIFTSLPRSGTVRAARLLAETGDCRSRFPDPQSLASLAGVAAVTRQSGTRISHAFRWAVSRQLRDAVCDFADGSRHASAWAASVYDAARARGKDHPHAVRILGRAWIWSSGAAGRKAPPTTRPSTPPCSASWTSRASQAAADSRGPEMPR